jgi:prolyl-tRNA synthetase
MRASHLFARTLRDDPAEAEAASHRLLLRAGYIRQLMSGVYTYLPLGWRTLQRIEGIIREEMDATGAQEIRMPIVLPAEPWKATGRWDVYGDLMFKLRDRHDRELGLGPTQEEVVTPLVAGELSSYRDLPVNLYQVEWKYRDEYRPRFGLLRGREFLMKDAYSFDRDERGMQVSYEAMVQAYRRMFDRCRVDYRVVEADPGQIGGGVNHEFLAISEVGEDLFVACENGDYLADLEAAAARPPESVTPAELEPLTEVATPGAATIQAVSELLGRPAGDMLKTILYLAGQQAVAVLVPGDREVSDAKVERAMWPSPVKLFDEDEFGHRGIVKGFAGPQGLPEGTLILADHSVRAGANWVTGANRPDHHVTGANVDRDFRVERWDDLAQIRAGDPCPNDGGSLSVSRGIVLGHTYQLGARYSVPLEATFVDEDGTDRPFQMGCYGIGLTRILAAAAEQFNDEAGLTWPVALAPFQAVVVPTNMDVGAVVEAAEAVYEQLRAADLAVVLDDREVTAGVKFADADLIGYPVQVVIGKRGIEAGTADLKVRGTGARSREPLATAAGQVVELLATLD